MKLKKKDFQIVQLKYWLRLYEHLKLDRRIRITRSRLSPIRLYVIVRSQLNLFSFNSRLYVGYESRFEQNKIKFFRLLLKKITFKFLLLRTTKHNKHKMHEITIKNGENKHNGFLFNLDSEVRSVYTLFSIRIPRSSPTGRIEPNQD